jgi:PKD repeat protein
VSVTLGTAVSFLGTASDTDGTIASHAWNFGDGSTASVEDPGNRTYASVGTYSVTYRVTDDDGAQSAQATRTVTVTAAPNQAPTASISSPSQNVSVTLGTAVSFLGTASDTDGTIASHAWNFGDGGTASVEDPGNRTYASVGTYSVTYRVTDDDGAQSAQATRTVTVTAAPNQAPTASISSPNQNLSVTLGSTVNFQGTASDTDGTIASHAWNFGDGSTASVEDPGNRTYAALGVYSVTYRVTDDDGAQSAVASRTVTVVALPNQAPTASISSPSQNVSVTLGTAVNFQGAASDLDGTIASHAWNFGDGSTTTVEDPGNRTYGSVGTYNVTYRVTDDDGAQSTVATRTVTVNNPPPPPPPGGPAFVSNFAGSTWGDNGKWEAVGGSNHNAYLQIFTTSLDANVPGGRGLRTIGTVGHNFWNVIRVAPGSQPRTPAVGETITWRFYYKLISGDGDGDYHPIDWGTNLLNSSPNFAVFKFVWFGGAWQPQIEISGAPRPWYATANSVLAPNTWYRFEVGWNRTGSSSWTVSYRIYGPNGALIVDTDDMLGNFGTEQNNRLSTMTFSNSSAVRSTQLEIGSPGVGGMVGSTHEAERYAAIAAFVGAPVVNVPFDAARGW